MAQKPSLPKGTRDFSSQDVAKRTYITKILRESFEHFGFQPIETPSFERSETLMGKYGEEGDRLIFKILNSGDFLAKADQALLENRKSTQITSQISEKALRYDLTVPFARYVVQHQNELSFPFKRYQIQPVWRADRPQKGRFREFYQCDADVVGSQSLWQEVELILLYDRAFHALGLNGVTIHMNNRKILSGIAEVIGAADQLIDFTVALDKLDKIGRDRVEEEMRHKGISDEAISKLAPLFETQKDNASQLTSLDHLLRDSQVGKQGIEELRFVLDAINDLTLRASNLSINLTLARGLNYYTGAIFEVSAPEGIELGSIGGGGRYDDLTGIFGLKGMSGIGISFGLDRIYMVLEAMDLFPVHVMENTRVMFVNFGDVEAAYAMRALSDLRDAGISCELYPDAAKMGKQMAYADKRGIPFVVMAGSQEIQESNYTVKCLSDGEQKTVTLGELIDALKA
ncbi:MAG: histidine--tRNA ligase [Flavobacteriaceae bacterium]|nr:histidine--tRNA ligase [Flavobacteriaceae bacterium]